MSNYINKDSLNKYKDMGSIKAKEEELFDKFL